MGEFAGEIFNHPLCSLSRELLKPTWSHDLNKEVEHKLVWGEGISRVVNTGLECHSYQSLTCKCSLLLVFVSSYAHDWIFFAKSLRDIIIALAGGI